MSDKAEDHMHRCVQSAARAARASDPEVREFYERMAQRWFKRAVEEKTSAARLELTYVKTQHAPMP